jgi:hypothetical protein
MGEKIPILGDDVEDTGGHGRVLPVRAHKTSSAVLLFLAQANRRAAVVLSKSRSPTYAKWLVAPGPIPIATAAWSAPASCGAANPGPPPWAPRTGAAAGRFLDRRVIGSGRGNGCRRSPGERTSSPNCAECRERKNQLSHRIPPLLAVDDSPSRRETKRGRKSASGDRSRADPVLLCMGLLSPSPVGIPSSELYACFVKSRASSGDWR